MNPFLRLTHPVKIFLPVKRLKDALLIAFIVALALPDCGQLSHAGLIIQGTTPDENRQAILIGAGEYMDESLRLPYIGQDVVALSEVLSKDQYTVVCLVDQDKNGAATRKNIVKELTDRLSRCSDDTVTIIYLSGHTVLGDDDTPYFLPVDVDLKRLKQTAIDATWLREELAKAKGRLKLLILDTCHAAAVGTQRSVKGRTFKSAPIHKTFTDVPGVYVLASCQMHQKSAIWEEKRHSLFTYWLIRGLKGQADGFGDGGLADQCITVDELFSFAHHFVPLAAQNLRPPADQVPDRTVGPGVDPKEPVLRSITLNFSTALDEAAELVSTVLQLRGINTVAIPDFHIPPEIRKHERPLGEEFSRECALRMETWMTQKKLGMFEVLVRESVQEQLRSQDLDTATILRRRIQEIKLEDYQLAALVLGEVESYDSSGIGLRIVLRKVPQAAILAQFRLRVALGPEIEPLIDSSLDFIPVPPREGNQTTGPPPTRAEAWDENSPFQAFVVVDGKRRPRKLVNGRIYVPLDVDERYEIHLELDSEQAIERLKSLGSATGTESGMNFWPVLARVLVDGRSTLPERPRVRKEGGVLKAINPEAKLPLEAAVPVPLEEASPWALPLFEKESRNAWKIPGFVSQVSQVRTTADGGKTQESQHTGSGEIHYQQFRVAEAKKVNFEPGFDYGEQLGVITVAFYSTKSHGTRGPGDKPGASGLITIPDEVKRRATIRTLTGFDLDHLVAILKIHYVTPKEWDALQGRILPDK